MTATKRDRLLDALPNGMRADAERVAHALKRASTVAIATHIDADGISAAAIASLALERKGIKAEVSYHKKLDEHALKSLKEKNADLVWFTDFGSGSLSKIEGIESVVTDHHVPEDGAKPSGRKGQTSLGDFSSIMHLNPQMHGISGANELSGAGCTLVAAVALDQANSDLAHLAVLGAVGDLQDQKSRRLEGLNRVILDVAQANGSVVAMEDIRYFGRETRPLHKLLEFSSDPYLPRITGNEEGALNFLRELGIELKEGDSWRTWSGLTPDEKNRIIAELRDYLLTSRRRQEVVDRLVGDVYLLVKEAKGTPLRDSKEYATLLNACGRHGKADVGLRICMGDRGDALSEGESLLRDHRSALSKALAWARGSGIIRLKNIQFFDAGDEIEDTIVGTVAGMLLGSEGADRTAPMVAFAESAEYSDVSKLKASGRGTQELVSKGMDLSQAMKRAAEFVGGVGGGHNIAAGATIPAERRDDFLSKLDEVVGNQITRKEQRR